jgi:L-cysteate sulfo-lyase
VRKLERVAAEALAAGADTLVTCGGVQSNHTRATAAVAARLGLSCVVVANGAAPERATANALLRDLLGASVEYCDTREERAPRMEALADRVRARGGRPFVIPLGASTPVGAAAFASAIDEMLGQIEAPHAIVHASSSGGTQAGLVAGCVARGLQTRVVGVSADDPSDVLARAVQSLASKVLGADVASTAIEVDDDFVGEGYGIETAASHEALRLAARTEALFLDPTYTAKAMAGLIAMVRQGRFREDETVLFWHTGGQVALFR